MSDVTDRKEREDRRWRSDADPSRTHKLEAGRIAAGPWRGSGLVLVIDDEAGIRRFAKRILENHGFTVATAADGLEGIKLFEDHQTETVLVLLDRSMPRLSGEEVLAGIHRLRPDMPVVISSGYADATAAQAPSGEVAGYVAKPYRVDELIAVVREALTWTPRQGAR
jgi:DNA-binding NtrC family response regulator